MLKTAHRRRGRSNIELVAVLAACWEELVAGEATHPADGVSSSTAWSADFPSVPLTTIRGSVLLQGRSFFVDDLDRCPGVDSAACQPDPAEDTPQNVRA